MAGTILPPAGYRCIPSVSCISSRGGGCPGEHWYTSGCFRSAGSFGLWCNGDSLCAQFASLPCPAGPLNSSTDTVFRKEKSLSAPPRSQSYQSPLDFGICFERKITFTAGETSSSLRSVPVSSAFIGMNCCLH